MKSLIQKIFGGENVEMSYATHKGVPTDVNEVREKGLQSAQIGDLKGAIETWTSALSVQPKNPEIHLLLAASFQVLHDTEASAKHYRMATKFQPQNIEAHLNLGMLLASSAIDKMSRTGHRFTIEQALQTHGYYEEALTAFANCKALGGNIQAIRNHLEHYQRLMWTAIMSAKPKGGIEGEPFYRSSSDWLCNMKFPRECFLEGKNVSDLLGDLKSSESVAYVLAHAPYPDNFSTLLKRLNQKHILVGPTMSDFQVWNIVTNLRPGDVLLADIERVALAGDFPGIKKPLWRRLVLILVNPNSMLLPELLGALMQTSILNIQGEQRDCLFVSLK